MDHPGLLVIAGYVGQSAWSVVVALLLFGFHRAYRRHYLRQSALAWSALAVHYAASAVNLGLLARLPATSAARHLVSAVSLAALYPALVWLLLGTHGVTTGRLASRRWTRRVLILAAMVGALSALIFATRPEAGIEGLVIRVLIPAGVAGIVFVAAAVTVCRSFWWSRRRPGGTGPILFAATLALYGLARLYLVAISLSAVATGTDPGYGVALPLVDFFLLSLIALGMAVWLLEEERRRATAAADQLDRLANYDPLTELMNRSAVFDRLDRACRRALRGGERIVVALLNLDRFKSINESLGHHAGDDLLRAVAIRLRRAVEGGLGSEAGGVARLGGDEFVAVHGHDGGDPEAAIRLAGDLVRAFDRPFDLAGREIHVSATVGVSRFPDDGATPEELLRHAGMALADARRRRARYRLYTADLASVVGQRLGVELDLRRALADGELDLVYQPLVRVSDGTVARVEALVRWWRPEGEEVMPYRFLPVAELIGLADELDDWVLARGLAQLAAWRAAGHRALRLAVNLSAHRFQDPELVSRVEELLRHADLPARCLDIEITERAAMRHVDASLYSMRALKDLGVRLTLDDFGTGYSSLSYLRRLPVDALKIDRSFVADLTSGRPSGDVVTATAIVRSIVGLGHSVGLEVVAEGVETAEQERLLAAEGCDLLQGFHLAVPASAGECTHLLEHGVAPLERRAAM